MNNVSRVTNQMALMPAHSKSDEELIALITSGCDAKSIFFSELVKRYNSLLVRRSQQRLGEYRAYADDVVQETWIRCHRYLNTFEHGSAFTTWLIRIVDNQCNTLMRKQMAYTEQEDIAEQLEQAMFEEEQLAEAGDLTHPVSETLEKLPDAMQDILTLRYQRNLPLQSISDLLGITLSAAKMRLYRAQTQFETHYRQTYNVADYGLMQMAS